jgi:hypothetical protein
VTLSEIAAGIETVTEQKQERRSVTTVDATERSLTERFAAADTELPCAPGSAATVVERYVRGETIEAAATAAGVAPVMAAKVLHRTGAADISPLSPAGRTVLQEWLAGERPRADALAVTDCSHGAFMLAAYVEKHGRDVELVTAVEAALTPSDSVSVRKRDRLAETMSAPEDLR